MHTSLVNRGFRNDRNAMYKTVGRTVYEMFEFATYEIISTWVSVCSKSETADPVYSMLLLFTLGREWRVNEEVCWTGVCRNNYITKSRNVSHGRSKYWKTLVSRVIVAATRLTGRTRWQLRANSNNAFWFDDESRWLVRDVAIRYVL